MLVSWQTGGERTAGRRRHSSDRIAEAAPCVSSIIGVGVVPAWMLPCRVHSRQRSSVCLRPASPASARCGPPTAAPNNPDLSCVLCRASRGPHCSPAAASRPCRGGRPGEGGGQAGEARGEARTRAQRHALQQRAPSGLPHTRLPCARCTPVPAGAVGHRGGQARGNCGQRYRHSLQLLLRGSSGRAGLPQPNPAPRAAVGPGPRANLLLQRGCVGTHVGRGCDGAAGRAACAAATRQQQRGWRLKPSRFVCLCAAPRLPHAYLHAASPARPPLRRPAAGGVLRNGSAAPEGRELSFRMPAAPPAPLSLGVIGDPGG